LCVTRVIRIHVSDSEYPQKQKKQEYKSVSFVYSCFFRFFVFLCFFCFFCVFLFFLFFCDCFAPLRGAKHHGAKRRCFCALLFVVAENEYRLYIFVNSVDFSGVYSYTVIPYSLKVSIIVSFGSCLSGSTNLLKTILFASFLM